MILNKKNNNNQGVFLELLVAAKNIGFKLYLQLSIFPFSVLRAIATA